MRILLLALAAASAAIAADIPGRYELVGVRETASELVLKPGGDFEYIFIYGAADYSARGKWKRDGDAVVLTTDPAASPPFELRSGSVVQSPGVRIHVQAPNGRAVPNIDVRIGPAEARTDSEGVAFFPGLSAPKSVVFAVRVYEFESEPVSLNPAQNDFTFQINGEAITRVPFNSERLRIVGEGLEMKFWDKSRTWLYRRS